MGFGLDGAGATQNFPRLSNRDDAWGQVEMWQQYLDRDMLPEML